MVKAVDIGAELAAQLTDFVQCASQFINHVLGAVDGGDLGARNGARDVAAGIRLGDIVHTTCQCCETAGNIQHQGFILGSTDLEGYFGAELAAGTFFAEQFFTGKAAVFHDIAQLFAQLVVFGLHRLAVGIAVGAVGRLGGEVFHALHDVGHFIERAIGGLQQRGGVADVAQGHGHAFGLRVHAGGDLQAGGVVGCRVDAQAGTQALLVGGQGVVGLVQVGLGQQRRVVGVDGQGHERNSCFALSIEVKCGASFVAADTQGRQVSAPA